MKNLLFISCVVVLSILASTEKLALAKTQNHSLPLPSTLPLQDYEKKLYPWLMKREYAKAGWAVDKEVRDTGPYIAGQYYGTHPAVRIYYSPEVVKWLEGGRKGEIPDGAIIVKEMFTPPAVLYQDLVNHPKYKDPKAYKELLAKLVMAWTVMVRDKKGSKDGWFWSNPMAPNKGESIKAATKRQLDTRQAPPASEFGAPCLRCHASAENEFTFSSLRNVEGYLPKEEPLRFLVDTSWRSAAHFKSYPLSILANDPYVKSHFMIADQLRPYAGNQESQTQVDLMHSGFTQTGLKIANDEALKRPNPEFIKTFPEIAKVKRKNVQTFPSQWMDHVVPGEHGAEEYITSDNCFGCHGGLGGEPYGSIMFVQTGPAYGEGYNISEYGEWRWSPMGLAGRDPIFYAQFESEMALLERDAKAHPSPLVGTLEENKIAVTNTCLSCHGAMGQRQLAIDAKRNPKLDPNFKIDYMFLQTPLTKKAERKAKKNSSLQYVKYGALGREGISCAICHHIDKPSEQEVTDWKPKPGWVNNVKDKELAYLLFHNSTGRFKRGPKDEFFGPFEKVAEIPMQQVLGVTPVHNEFITDSQLCGTCHTINLPNIGATEDRFPILNAAETNPAFKDYQHSIEQATFLEWQNSVFAQNPGKKGTEFASCQDCHMPSDVKTLENSSKGKVDIQSITTQIAAIQDANFPEADNRLPVEDIDIPLRDNYKRHEHVGLNVFLLEMFDQFPDILGVDKNDYMTSADNGVDFAIENMIRQAQEFSASIKAKITSYDNKKLKAKVTVKNKTGHRFPSGVAFRRAFIEFVVMDGDKVVWGSGRSNKVGVIVDGEGKPLKTEFLNHGNLHQPHYQTITRQDQVQIYEELNQNAQHEFTTSFIHRVFDIKDNRLLPKGWRASSFFKKDGEVLYEFFEATDPHGTGDDPDYRDQGPGFAGEDSLIYDIDLPYEIASEKLSVKATLYYQAIPPSWLHQRFTTVPKGKATQRLYYMTSHLNLKDTPMEGWKLKLVSDKNRYR